MTKVRTRSSRLTTVRTESWTPPNPVGLTGQTLTNRYDYSDTITYPDDLRGGNWRKLIATKSDATTNYQGVIHKVETAAFGSGFATASGNQTNSVSGQLHLGPPRSTLSGITSSKADSRARIAFINNYHSRRQSFQGGVFLGELRETLHMIKRPLSAFRQGLDRYHSTVKRRLKGRRTNSAGDVIAGTWLEYSFGWKPLISDVKDGMKALAETVAGKWVGDTIYAQGEDNGQIGTTSETINLTVSQRFVGDFYYVRKGDSSVRYKGWVGSKMNEPPSLAENWGVNFGSIVPTVWELIPYSFLVDYFTNAGDVINAMSQGSVSLRWGWRTVRNAGSVYLTRSNFRISSPGWSGSCSCSPGLVSQTVSVDRKPISSVEAGLSDFHWEIPMNPAKWLNIGALARLRR